jgi:hypothetical protein
MTKQDLDFIEKKVLMLKDNYSEEHVKQEVWDYALACFHNKVRLDSIIHIAMGLWATIMIEYLKQKEQ